MEMAVKAAAMEEEAKRGGDRRCGVGGSSYAGRPATSGAPPLTPFLHDFLGL